MRAPNMITSRLNLSLEALLCPLAEPPTFPSWVKAAGRGRGEMPPSS